jgi:hypothetical protein
MGAVAELKVLCLPPRPQRQLHEKIDLVMKAEPAKTRNVPLREPLSLPSTCFDGIGFATRRFYSVSYLQRRLH